MSPPIRQVPVVCDNIRPSDCCITVNLNVVGADNNIAMAQSRATPCHYELCGSDWGADGHLWYANLEIPVTASR